MCFCTPTFVCWNRLQRRQILRCPTGASTSANSSRKSGGDAVCGPSRLREALCEKSAWRQQKRKQPGTVVPGFSSFLVAPSATSITSRTIASMVPIPSHSVLLVLGLTTSACCRAPLRATTAHLSRLGSAHEQPGDHAMAEGLLRPRRSLSR